MELTVVIPCLDEAETVATCVSKAVRFIADNGIDGEVIVADNGTDWFISVAPDPRIPQMNAAFAKVKGADFEVVVAPH